MAPPVIAFHCGFSGRGLAPERIDSVTDRIVSVERPDAWRFADWDARRDALLAQGAEAA